MTGPPHPPSTDHTTSLDLYWIPLGADTPTVAISGRLYETAYALTHRQPRRDLYHTALIAHTDSGTTTIESAPVLDNHGTTTRGVVAEGPVGSRALGRIRIFRYEVRRWPGGTIPDLTYAINSPVQLTTNPTDIHRVLDQVAHVPSLVWGRDENHLGDMWNSNSIISWTLSRTDLLDNAGDPPNHGRAPGWNAGIALAAQQDTPTTVRPPLRRGTRRARGRRRRGTSRQRCSTCR